MTGPTGSPAGALKKPSAGQNNHHLLSLNRRRLDSPRYGAARPLPMPNTGWSSAARGLGPQLAGVAAGASASSSSRSCVRRTASSLSAMMDASWDLSVPTRFLMALSVAGRLGFLPPGADSARLPFRVVSKGPRAPVRGRDRQGGSARGVVAQKT